MAFTTTKSNLIEKGFKHIKPPKFSTNTFESIEVDVELALKEIPNNLEHKYKSLKLINVKLLKCNWNCGEHKTVNWIKGKIENDNIFLSSADKQNSVI